MMFWTELTLKIINIDSHALIVSENRKLIELMNTQHKGL